MNNSENASPQGLGRYLSPLSAWALSFGCAVGWGVFVMPGTTFLPVAGPLGTLLGLAIGAVLMLLVGMNYHFLIRRFHGAGGAYDYVKHVCGYDHGYLCAWFLLLTYVAIAWANVTALALIERHLLGGLFCFGFRYHVAGYDVYAGEILLSVVALLVVGAILVCSKRLAARIQTVFALALAAGMVVGVTAVIMHHKGGLASFAPAFAKPENIPFQVFSIVALAPWAFIGFESISNSAEEFNFRRSRTIWIMAAAVIVATAAYFSLSLAAAAIRPSAFSSWRDYAAALGKLEGLENLPAFYAVKSALGTTGIVLACVAAFAAIVTGMVGIIIAASRLLCAMAHDGIMPRRLAEIDERGNPRKAIVAIVAISCLVPLVGRTVVSWVVDVTTIGASIAYGYVSFCALRMARREGHRLITVSGVIGLAVSIAFVIYFMVPNFWIVDALATESYFILAAWSITGVILFRGVSNRDQKGLFGNSSTVWLIFLFFVFFSGHMWMRQSMNRLTDSVVAEVGEHYAKGQDGTVAQKDAVYLEHEKNVIENALVDHNLIQLGLVVIALAIMFNIYSAITKREKEAGKAKSYFFSTISHDIRTPLNAIVGYSEMLKLGFKTKEERDEAIESILISSKSLLALVNDILDLSRRESGKIKLSLMPTDCHALLHEVEETFRVGGAKPGLEVREKIDEMPLLLVDPLRLRHIAVKLAANAVKFTEKGFIEIRARFDRDGDEDEGTLVIEIEDTGVGISEEDKHRISSPYVKVASKISRHGGTGLGLAVCRQYAEAMGGALSFDSELGKGSTFRITIPDVKMAAASSESPSANADAAGNAAVVAAEPATDADAVKAEPLPHKNPRLLLVDDAKMNLTVLKALIKRMGGFETETAMDGKEAFARLQQADAPGFDAVLTDMWMPELDGEGLAKAIREDPKLAHLPVHVITADVELRNTYVEKGFSSIILKPVTVNALGPILKHIAENKGAAA